MWNKRYQNEFDSWENRETDYHSHSGNSRDNRTYSSVNYCSNCGTPINKAANRSYSQRQYNQDARSYSQKHQTSSSCSSVLIPAVTIIALIITIAAYNVSSSSAYSGLSTGQDTNIKYNNDIPTPISESVEYQITGAISSADVNQPSISTSRTYVVKPGDTLYRIATQMLGNGSRWIEIDRLNNLGRLPNGSVLIHPGQVLIIPDQ